jgi:protein TonB
MPSASLPASFVSRGPPRRERIVTVTLVALLHILLLLLLLRLAPLPAPKEAPMAPLVVDLLKGTSAAPEQTRVDKAKQARAKAAPRTEAVRALTRTSPDIPEPPLPSIWSQVIPLTHDELAATDKAMRSPLRRASDSPDSGESRTAATGITDSTEGPGAGPHGETLYNARWYREPTDAELGTYLPPGRRQTGWGMIACRTVPGNRVEDCHEIGQSPGSGLAGAVRRAAWQFRVLPPRINGRPMIGEWVRIRIDYTVTVSRSEVSGPR